MKSFKEEIDEMKENTDKESIKSKGTDDEQMNFGAKFTLASVQFKMKLAERKLLSMMLENIDTIEKTKDERVKITAGNILIGTLKAYKIVFGGNDLDEIMKKAGGYISVDGKEVKDKSNRLSDIIDGLDYPEED